MSTVVYGCGCWFSYSMFGEYEPMGWALCEKHCNHPALASVHCVQEEIHAAIKALLAKEGEGE